MNPIAEYFHLTEPLPPSPIEVAGATRDDLPKMFAAMGFTRGAEIGVWTGDYSKQLLDANPALHLSAIDPWAIYRDYRDNNQQHRMEEKYRIACETLQPYVDAGRCTIVRKFSTDAAEDFEPESLDFVYVDGNHAFEYVALDLALWGRRVRPDGIVSGHDYYHFKLPAWCHVVEAVHGYTTALRVKEWFVLGTRHEARRSELQHRYRSYCWVNPIHPKSRQHSRMK